MVSELTFLMGKFEARIPDDRVYSENHLWLQAVDEPNETGGSSPAGDSSSLSAERRYRVGFTAYSVRLLQDVYFLEWSVDPGTAVLKKQEIGEVESSKAVSSLYSPVDGVILTFNERLLDDPSAINIDGYGTGFLFTMQTTATLMTAEEYVRHLAAGWDKTEKLIKGQYN